MCGVPVMSVDASEAGGGIHIERVGVVGGGLMGSGIVEVCARAGRDVVLIEVDQKRLDATRHRIDHSLERAMQRGKLTGRDRDEAMARIGYATELGALADSDLVVEAIVEQESAKVELFARLDEVVRSRDAILASNTSSIPIVKLATATGRPEQVLGVHSSIRFRCCRWSSSSRRC
jgi:3-hydroxybutyryl-CoA dehydrogenase